MVYKKQSFLNTLLWYKAETVSELKNLLKIEIKTYQLNDCCLLSENVVFFN